MKLNKLILLQKISSRKFWSLLIGLVGSILLAFNVDAGSVEQITAIIGGFGTIIMYMLAEAIVDKARAENQSDK